MSAPTVEAALRAGAARLAFAGVPDAGRDARRLMAAALGVGPDGLISHLRDPIGPSVGSSFERFVTRREAREPVSHILGGRWFYGRWFEISADVLDPRPETETLVECALAERFEKLLDLGTGSGAIAISLLAERPGARAVGTDVSSEALAIAGRNAEAHGVTPRLILPLSNWFEDVGGRYDLIVSNPPYIAAGEMPSLAPEVRDWEPRAALTDGGDGLSAYRAIARGAPDHLRPGGRLIVEIGATQGQAVSALFRAVGLEEVAVHPDLGGVDRIVLGHASLGEM
ncbi:MAG: peptide chain release factor N(5)-glutamine methyltransferase [Pseudomonadota bacterium]